MIGLYAMLNPHLQDDRVLMMEVKTEKEYLDIVERVVDQGPYDDTWESLTAYEVPEWFREARFGIFIHWGVYSVPAYSNEWYPREMYDSSSHVFHHHMKTYGAHKDFGYIDFIPMFRGEHFDPEAWGDLIAASGARYAVPVAEHHDGFQMYRSSLSRWNACEMGPQRDVVGELFMSFRKRGIITGLSSHRAEHWFFMEYARATESGTDCDNPDSLYFPSYRVDNIESVCTHPQPDEAYLQSWLARCAELVETYHPSLVYFDWWIEQEAFKPYLRKFLAYYYNRAFEWGINPVVTYKHDAAAFGSAVIDIERGQFADVRPFLWQTCTAIGRKSWGYIHNNEYKDSEEILQNLVDVVSKNGSLLLNIGPKSDGTITEEESSVLLDTGRWLVRNGEAIYGVMPWHFSGEGESKVASGAFSDKQKPVYTERDIRYTIHRDKLYAIVLKRSRNGRYSLWHLRKADPKSGTVFFGIVRKVECLDDGKEYPFFSDADGLHIAGPESTDPFPIAFRITLA